MTKGQGIAVIAGVGPGMGIALARRFARAGFDIGMIARNGGQLDNYCVEVQRFRVRSLGVQADLCEVDQVRDAFSRIGKSLGEPNVLIYNAAHWHEASSMQIDPKVFAWDLALSIGGALLCAQQCYPAMKRAGSGTMLFTGGGLALRPEYGAGVSSLAAGKAGLRALAYALNKELEPDGIHVATLTIAGTVKRETAFDPDRIAEEYWQLHQQPRERWQVERVFDGT